MKQYGVFYGSATGTTAKVAEEIGKALGTSDNVDVVDVSKAAPDMLGDYEVLVLGTSTWGDGEVEDDWYDLLAGIEELALRGKKIALFGCGDETMADTFCNGVGELYERLQKTGAEFIAPFDASCYRFNSSSAIVAGQAVGLLLDEVNHADLTPGRIADWTSLVRETAKG